MSRFLRSFLWLVAAQIATSIVVITGSSAQAVELVSEWAQLEHGVVRIVAASDSIGPSGTIELGVQMRLARGWKTYWRVPGQSGVPTRFDWSLSTNAATIDVSWPTPRRFSDYESETYGYEKDVIFPVHVVQKVAGQPVQIDLTMSFGVCRDVCIPMKKHMSLAIPVSELEAKPTKHAFQIEYFQQKVPLENGANGLFVDDVTVSYSHVTDEISVMVRSEKPLEWPDAVFELPPEYRLGNPSSRVSRDRLTARLTMPLWSDGNVPTLEGREVVIVLWDDDGRAIERKLVIKRVSRQ